MNVNKIDTLPKRLSFATPELNLALSFIIVNSWLLYYFVNILEMPAGWAGTAFLLGRLVDAFFDPFIGRLSDRMQHKVGRKIFITWSLIPAALAFIAIWYLPSISTNSYVQFALASLAFMVFSFFYTLISIPRHAMLPALVPEYDQRTKQVTYNMVFVMLAVLIGIALTPALVLQFSQGAELATSPASAWWLTIGCFTVLGLIFYLPFVFFIPDSKQAEQASSKVHLIRDFVSVFRERGFVLVMSINVITVIATLIVQSMLPFYLESVINLPGSEQQTILSAIFLLSIISFPLWAIIGRRFGKSKAMICGILIYIVFLAMVPFLPRTGATPMLYMAAVLSGIGISSINLFPIAMLPDSVDEDTLRHGIRREGLVYSSFLFMTKCAGSIGVFANAIILSVFEHKAGQIDQSESTIQAFVWMTGPVPLVLFLFAIVLCIKYPITRESHALTQAKIIKMESSYASTQK